MKKILNNKVYDTETAKSCGYIEYGNGSGDLNYIFEELYRKKTGEFFLYGKGGARTQYAVPTSDGWYSGGWNIIPMSYERAQKWAESNLSADKYEKIFGKIEENDNIVRKEFSLKADKIERLKRAASKRGITMTALVEELIDSLDN